MKQYIIASLFSFNLFAILAQTGGFNAFQNLNATYSARQLGLGGDIIAIYDNDIQAVFSNPSLLNKVATNKAFIGQTILPGGINTGSLLYGKQYNNITTAAHFRYIAYGKMQRTDVNGTDLGHFSPGELIGGVSASKSINERLYIGGTLNLLYSQIDDYNAFGASLDVGGCYKDDSKRLVIAGVVKNLGYQFNGYTAENYPLPLEVQLGISHKLAHAPFRFSLIGQHLQQWDLTYRDPNAKPTVDQLSGDTIPINEVGFFEKLAHHGLIQTEILLGKKLHIRVGFDFHRRLELALTNRPGMAGFSFGTGMYFKRFSLDYGWMIYSSAGSQHGISLTIPIGSI